MDKVTRYSKALILNDTSHECHVGCSLVMRFLKRVVLDFSAVYESLSIAEAKKGPRVIDFDDCDLIVVNGEGTFHHDGKAAFIWVELVRKLKARNPKRRFLLLNAGWFYNESLNRYLQLFDFVSFRERESFRSASPYIDLSRASVCPDFAYLESLQLVRRGGLSQTAPVEGRVYCQRGVSGKYPQIYDTAAYLSVFIGRDRFKSLWSQLNKRDVLYLEVILRKFREHFLDIRLMTVDDYVNTTAELKFLSTGRFHGVMIAVACNIDCAWVHSNTPKTEAAVEYLADLAGVEAPSHGAWFRLDRFHYSSLYENSINERNRLLASAF